MVGIVWSIRPCTNRDLSLLDGFFSTWAAISEEKPPIHPFLDSPYSLLDTISLSTVQLLGDAHTTPQAREVTWCIPGPPPPQTERGNGEIQMWQMYM